MTIAVTTFSVVEAHYAPPDTLRPTALHGRMIVV